MQIEDLDAKLHQVRPSVIKLYFQIFIGVEFK